MAQDANGCYVDENSDYSFLCNYCEYWCYVDKKQEDEDGLLVCKECLEDEETKKC